MLERAYPDGIPDVVEKSVHVGVEEHGRVFGELLQHEDCGVPFLSLIANEPFECPPNLCVDQVRRECAARARQVTCTWRTEKRTISTDDKLDVVAGLASGNESCAKNGPSALDALKSS